MHDVVLPSPAYWWACEFPERPAELITTVFDMDCPRCAIAKEAAQRHYPGFDFYTPSFARDAF